MRKILLFLSANCYFMVFTACNKHVEKPEEILSDTSEMHFSPDGMKYIQLPYGAYYIYKDSALGAEDSVVVSISDLGTMFSGAGSYPVGSGIFGSINQISAAYYDVFALELKNPLNNKQWFYGRASAYKASIFPGIYNEIPIKMDDNLDMMVFGYPAYTSDAAVGDMTVEGVTYHNVLKTDSWNGLDITYPGYVSQTLWWAKNVGLIQWKKQTGSLKKTYTLLRHG